MTNAGDGAQFNPEHPTPQQPDWSTPDQPVAHIAEGSPYNPEPVATQQWPAMPVPVKSKKTATVVVAILAVLFLGTTGAFGALYFSEKSDHDAVSAQLVDKDNVLADKDKALSSANQNAEAAKKEQESAESKALGYKACHDAATALRDAAVNGADDTSTGSLAIMLFTACN